MAARSRPLRKLAHRSKRCGSPVLAPYCFMVPSMVWHVGMGEMRKITVEVPVNTLALAQEQTGAGVTETVRAALRKLASIRAQQKALSLRGKIKFSVDLVALRQLED